MTPQKYVTLHQFLSIVKEKLSDALPHSYWMTAEISEMKVNYSGHCYLELVEKGGKNQVPKAKVSAVIWRSTYGALSSYFHSAAGCPLAEGMSVLIKAAVNYHELYGFSLVISDIDPLYTIGDMERQRQETIRKLREEGVYDMNREIPVPVVVQRIAVVSSRNAAGYRDFMNELRASCYRFRVELFDSFMQGHETEDSVVSALEAIANRLDEFDVVVVIRGGGSQSDLAAFDSYRLCCHIAQFPLPVITGIGHDKDQSVADLVAAVSLKTPTAVAAFLVDALAEVDGWLMSARQDIIEAAVTYFDEENRFLQSSAFSLARTTSAMTRSVELRFERLGGEIRRRSLSLLTAGNNTLAVYAKELSHSARRILDKEASRLAYNTALVRSRRPENILSMGFAIVSQNGSAVKTADQLKVGDNIEIQFASGTVGAEINNLDNGKK